MDYIRQRHRQALHSAFYAEVHARLTMFYYTVAQTPDAETRVDAQLRAAERHFNDTHEEQLAPSVLVVKNGHLEITPQGFKDETTLT